MHRSEMRWKKSSDCLACVSRIAFLFCVRCVKSIYLFLLYRGIIDRQSRCHRATRAALRVSVLAWVWHSPQISGWRGKASIWHRSCHPTPFLFRLCLTKVETIEVHFDDNNFLSDDFQLLSIHLDALAWLSTAQLICHCQLQRYRAKIMPLFFHVRYFATRAAPLCKSQFKTMGLFFLSSFCHC